MDSLQAAACTRKCTYYPTTFMTLTCTKLIQSMHGYIWILQTLIGDKSSSPQSRLWKILLSQQFWGLRFSFSSATVFCGDAWNETAMRLQVTKSLLTNKKLCEVP